MRVNQPVTQRERLYPSHQNLISTTDLESRITCANDEFCQIAGFTLEELQGAPHNLVRHPDMPPQAFADMWRHLREGKSWMGPVKNRCKNGDHYWVNAFVTPIQDASGKVVEYQSVRTAPDDAIKQRAERVYDEMRRGKTPRALRLPPCCHTLGIHLCLMALLASLVTLGYQHGPGWPLLIGALPLVVALVICQTLSRRLARLETLARHRFDNPLMQLLYTGRVDRLAAVELAMKMNQAEFNAVLARTQQTCQQIVQAAQTDLSNAESITGNLQQQQAQTNQVATAITEMTASIREVSHSSSASSDSLDNTAVLFREGNRSVLDTVAAVEGVHGELLTSRAVIEALASQCRAIDGILDVINNIANQTNLLALNAAIEAARAGEMGRGFAVVADEVRTLAQRTQASTDEIQQMIQSLKQGAENAVASMHAGQSATGTGVQSSQQTGASLTAITGQVEHISDMNQQVATATEEQSAVTEEINRNVQGISDLARATAAEVQACREDCRTLQRLSEDLARQVGGFKLH